jgi:hypothetical protein
MFRAVTAQTVLFWSDFYSDDSQEQRVPSTRCPSTLCHNQEDHNSKHNEVTSAAKPEQYFSMLYFWSYMKSQQSILLTL